MKYLDGFYYVEVKDHRYELHPTENIIIRKPDPPISLRTQYQVQNETQIRKNQKVIKINNNELEGKNYPKRNNQLFKNLNHPYVLLVSKLFGSKLIKFNIAEIANILLTHRNIRLIKKFLDKIENFLPD